MLCKRKSDSICGPVLNDKVVNDHFKEDCKGKAKCNITKFDDLMGKSINTAKIYT